MSFEQAKMIAKAAVDLDRANRHHEALQYYMDASQMLIELARTEKDDLRRNAYVRERSSIICHLLTSFERSIICHLITSPESVCTTYLYFHEWCVTEESMKRAHTHNPHRYKGHAVSYLNRAEAIKKHERYLSFQKERQEEEALYGTDHFAERILGENLLRAGVSVSTKTFFQETRMAILAFGAFWSAKSRNVIEKLVKLCEGKSDVLCVVFLSSDRSKTEFDRFTRTFSSNEGFASVPFHRRDIKGKLSQRFQIDDSRLPKLVLIDCKANGNVLTTDAGAAFEGSGSSDPLNVWISMSCDKTPLIDKALSSNGEDTTKKQSVLLRTRELLSTTASSAGQEKVTLETLMKSLNTEFGEEVVLSVRRIVLSSFKTQSFDFCSFDFKCAGTC